MLSYQKKAILADMLLGVHGAPIIVNVINTAPKDSAKEILSLGLGLFKKQRKRNSGIEIRKTKTRAQLRYVKGSK